MKCALLVLVVPSLVFAAEPAKSEEVVSAEKRIETSLLKPLAERDEQRAMFSRARVAPKERRVRVTQVNASTDANEKSFFAFAIDSRFRGAWREADQIGCVYPASGEIFVKMGETFRSADALLGKKTQPAAAGICVSTTPEVAAR